MEIVQTKAKVINDSSGVDVELPVLLTPDGVLEPLVDYLLSRSHARSRSWMKKVVLSTKLFLQYGAANAGLLAQSPALAFQQFAQRLTTGTIGVNGIDPSGLYWEPLNSENAGTLIRCLTDFSDWLSSENSGVLLNPKTSSSAYDGMLGQMAAEYKRNHSFLGHIQAKEASFLSRQVRAARGPKVDEESAIAFPDKDFSRLLTAGFVTAGVANLRDILITLLMHGAGFRMCECFHLWIHDVIEDPRDPTLAAVRIHHPEQGSAPRDWADERGEGRRCNRAAYLKGRYGLVSVIS